MTKAQQTTINLLESWGYILVAKSIWPEYQHPKTGKCFLVDFEGRQVDQGWVL